MEDATYSGKLSHVSVPARCAYWHANKKAVRRASRYLALAMRQITQVAEATGSDWECSHVGQHASELDVSLQEIFIRAAAVSRLQWHPFTVIAGDQPNTYTAYIKACGGWTRSLISR